MPAAAQTVQFEPQPGRNELSGRLIVRPKQIEALVEEGKSFPQAAAMHDAADQQMHGRKLKYAADTDEYVIQVPAGKTEGSLAAELLASGLYEYAEPDWIVYPAVIPNDPQYGSQWHLNKIGSPLAWNLLTNTSNVVIALADTGVRLDHEDFQGALVPGYNAVDRLAQANGGQVGDVHGHGTHTAGIVAAQSNNMRGVSGVGWSFRIMPIRVSNSTNGAASLSDLTAGARWAAENGARVVSTSFSGVDNASVETTGQYVRNTRNALYCWAAGNDGRWLTMPMPSVTVVGASDQNDGRAGFSAWGPTVDVFAPGVNILSTSIGGWNAYTAMSGTSMACPVVAGLAGMVAAANPNLTASEIESVIFSSALDLGASGRDDAWGWGRIRMNEAMQQTYAGATFNPATFAILRGVYISGGIGSLASADGQFLAASVRPLMNSGDKYWVQTQYDGYTTNLIPSQLEVRFKGYVTFPSVIQQIELFNWLTNAYVQIDARVAPTTNTEISTYAPVPQRFVQAGTGRIRARITQDSLFTRSNPTIWRSYTDLVSFRTPAF